MKPLHDSVASAQVPVPSPWDELEWYKGVSKRFELRWWKNHPVAGNLSCMVLALNLALQSIDARWFHPLSEQASLIVDRHFQCLDRSRETPRGLLKTGDLWGPKRG